MTHREQNAAVPAPLIRRMTASASVLLDKLRTRLHPGSVALKPFSCPICGPSVLFRSHRDETAVRCVRCLGTPIHFSIVEVVSGAVNRPDGKILYELSSRGAAYSFYRRAFSEVVASEFFEDAPLGDVRAGVRCEDVQRLTFEDDVFDVCTCTEVLEHVPDDASAFREVLRVLKPGGLFAFTVPLSNESRTVDRARMQDGELILLRPPVYHGDRIRGESRVLVFRDYGMDILDRVLAAGFESAKLHRPSRDYFGYSRPVIAATKR